MVLPPDIRMALGLYAERLRARFGARLRLVRLFGSWARGAAHEDSDIDVAAVVDDLTRDEWRDAVGDVSPVELSTGVSLSPLVLSGERFDELVGRERRIARDILNEGLPL